jgi:hypothetical protein
MKRTRTALGALAAAAALAATPASAIAATSQPLDAAYSGGFAVVGAPGSTNPFDTPIFEGRTWGRGTESTLGALSYLENALQNLQRSWNGCSGDAFGGSSGEETLTFAAGTLTLRRYASQDCVTFPIVADTDHFHVASGTGPFAGASGDLTSTWTGYEPTGTAQGTLTGTLRLR